MRWGNEVEVKEWDAREVRKTGRKRKVMRGLGGDEEVERCRREM